MKLFEITDDEPIQYTLLRSLFRKGKKVVFDYQEIQRNFSRWHNGIINDIIHAPVPPGSDFPETLSVFYVRGFSGEGQKGSIRLKRETFDKLKLYKSGDHWMLSDRKPSPDDEPMAEETTAEKYPSLVLTMLDKALSKGVPVNILIKPLYRNPELVAFLDNLAEGPVSGFRVSEDGRALAVNYQKGFGWADYRFRALTPKSFDDHFTLKKIDGILTFTRK